MASVEFTPNLSRHIECETLSSNGANLRELIDEICCDNPQLKPYILDDQDRLRKHVTVFIDGVQVQDRKGLNDLINMESSVYIAQALSGG
ncbi:MAG: MoaD/ThiS family protein [Gammaproteobacteria bacterium]|jgi:hypothetical protein|nr:MoaD/ThiS family protein [Gammaproteobacteria bacterium]MBT3859116.1 MoaD/ThiS family protein [Gammaproteobacteria bacterium]MBT3987116.1 MoaD/ThiS family protein [Gammaproteobacteria bacterium]MBT4255696.1 MoaD/ThiS family protein [Gammaproteobacteria bacterium]MBT4580535.1 MoaD/ThiS family protein [Gammaproteobacteria bacterium]